MESLPTDVALAVKTDAGELIVIFIYGINQICTLEIPRNRPIEKKFRSVLIFKHAESNHLRTFIDLIKPIWHWQVLLMKATPRLLKRIRTFWKKEDFIFFIDLLGTFSPFSQTHI